MSAARWTNPQFVNRAHRWIRDVGARHGYELTGAIEQPHVRAWSTVFRAPTRRGWIFLKCCGPSQAHEPRLTELLVRVAGPLVPTLIARHPREDWMLLADGGKKARELFRGRELLREWARVLPQYAEIQLALLGRAHDLLATRTPDHRLERLPSLIRMILDDHTVTRRPGYDHVTADDERRIRATIPVIAARCDELAELGIGPTIQHDDLHDANVLRRGSRTVIFDWGDACVSHPFLSLTVALRFAAARVHTSESDPRILRLRDAYLEPFDNFASRARLRRGAAIGRRLGAITRALSWYRVVTLSGGAPDLGSETFAGWLRLLPRAFPSARLAS